MKKSLFLSLLSFIFIVSAFSQFDISKREPCWYKGARRDSLRYVEFECGKLLGVIDCNNKLMYDEGQNIFYAKGTGAPYTGDCETCHNNGLREHLIHFVNGKEDGVDTTYYRSGCVMVVRSLSLGAKNGRWTYYYDSTARPAWIRNYMNNELNGEQIYFNKQGDTTKWEFYANGVLNGVRREYYTGSILKKEINYKNGIFDGDYVTYFKSGKPKLKLHYDEGEKDGKLEYFYDKDAALMRVGYYSKGIKDGEFTTFYVDGNIMSKGFYDKGKKQGVFIEKYSSGRLKSKTTYEDDEVIAYEKYDAFGRLTEKFPKETAAGMEDDALPGKEKEEKTKNSKKEEQKKEAEKKPKDKKEKKSKKSKQSKKDKKHS